MPKVLTSKFVENVSAPSEGMAEYWDAGLPGFSLRVMSSGYKSFSFRYRSGDGYKRLSWKLSAFTLSEARGEAEKAVRAVERGEKPAKPGPAGSARPLKELYLDHLKKTVRRWKTAETELSYVSSLPTTKADVRAIITEIAKKHPVQANRVLSRIRAMFNWAIGEDLTTVNPAIGLKKTYEKPRGRVLSDEELVKVWLATETLEFPAREVFQSYILSGQRRDEVRLAHGREVQGSDWVIPASRYKNGKDHLVPLTDTLETLMLGRGFVFSLTQGETAYTNVQKPLRTLRKNSGVKGWSIHDLRRTMRTGLSRLGIPPHIAERVIGHSFGGRLGATYDVYSYREEKLAALLAWEKHVMQLLQAEKKQAA